MGLLFNEFGDQTSPTGLMASTHALARVTVEVFMECDTVSP